MIKLYSGRSGYLAGNAGDEVSAPLIRALTGLPVQVMAEPGSAELFGAGSILEHVTGPGQGMFMGAVWGSGFMFEESRLDAPVEVLALRGPLTARRWKNCPDVPLGDPGLLVSRIWPASPKRWRLGIVPHYADYQDERVTRFARRWQEEVTVIGICGHVEDVCRLISSCDFILSSSLHGLIFAESYGIPNGRLILSDKVAGGSFKFRDYIGAFGSSDAMNIPFDGSETVDAMVSRIGYSWPEKLGLIQGNLITALKGWVNAR